MRKIILSGFMGIALTLPLCAQNPFFIAMPSPTAVPAGTVDTYLRATDHIGLDDTFDYGSATTGTSSILNLSISDRPPYVNSNYPDMTNWYAPDEGAVYDVIPGAASVGADGSFQYSIPIDCPPGTAGMQPDLAIVYNHNAANSWLGMGFNLAGLSAVSRTNKLAFYDGLNAPITFSNSSDAYQLDGQRIFTVSGTPGGNGTTYRFEEDNFNTITSIISSGTLYFVVNTRDGRTIEYGSTADSRNTAKSSSDVLHWCIKKVTDAFGNYMVYNYTNVNGEMLIDNIQYTGNGSTAPYNTISFIYMDRSDQVPTFVSGREFDRTRLLKKIVCAGSSGAPVRQYILDYDFASSSYLRRVGMVDAQGNQLNPTHIDYVTTPTAAATSSAPISSNPGNIMNIIAADMNGDGLQDIVTLNSPGTNTVDIKITGTGGVGHLSVPSGSFITNALDNQLIVLMDTYVFDEDDDNRDEVFYLYKYVSGGSSPEYKIKRLKFNGTSYDINTEVDNTSLPIGYQFNFWQPNYPSLHFAGSNSGYLYAKEDVSGDNLRDVILGDSEGFTVTPANGQPSVAVTFPFMKVQLGDFNGDGALDIYALTTPATRSATSVFEINVYSFVNSFSLLASTQVDINQSGSSLASTLTAVMAQQGIQFGDIDGDGKTDVFYMSQLNSTHNNLSCMRSNGQSFVSTGHTLTILSTLNTLVADFFIGDMNHDGRDDWAATSHDASQNFTFFSFYPSDGDAFLPNDPVNTNNPYIKNWIDLGILGVTGDFDGDGALDYYLTANPTSNISDLYSNVFTFGSAKRLARNIYNLKTNNVVDYTLLPNPGDLLAYKTGSSGNPSAFKIYAPKQYVTSRVFDCTMSTSYQYYNGLMHRAGKGFLGFEKVTATPQNAPASITSYTYDGTGDYLVTSETYGSVTGVTSTLTSHATTNLNYTVTAAPLRYLAGSVSTAKDYLASTNSKTTIQYDNSTGCVTSHKQEWLPWSGGTALRSEETDYTYATVTNTASSTPITRLTSSTLNLQGNSYSNSYETDYSYDAAGHLQSTVANANISGSAVTTSYSAFNAFGLPTITGVSAPDLGTARSSTVQYDATGRFVTKSTNALGNAELYEYDADQGLRTKYTDATGLVTEYSYDGMGRLVKTRLPNNAVNTVSYGWRSYTVSVPFATTYYAAQITTNIEGVSQSTVQLNNKDQPVREDDAVWDSRTSITTYAYNSLYQLTVKTEPRYSTAGSYAVYAYSYDAFFRPSGVTESIGFTQTNAISYSVNVPSTETTYNPGYSTVVSANSATAGSSYTVRYNDAAGQNTKVVNYGSSTGQHTVTYQYNAAAQPISATTAFPGNVGNAVTSFQYDALGRQNQITDPSAGTTQFHYNSIGELTAQIVPTGASYTLTYSYDALGRLSQKTGSLGTTTIDYVTSGNGLQQVKKVTGPEVITEYTYDALNRPVQSKETLVNTPGKVFTTNLSYDIYGRVINYTYPNGFVTTSQYDGLGNLTKISNGSATLWQLVDMATPVLISKYDYAQSFHNTINYSSTNDLGSITAGTLSTQTYSIYHGNGDVMSREYSNSSSYNNERFAYDGFSRLAGVTYTTGAAPTTPVTRGTYSYQDDGNLSSKDDCGTYAYSNSSKPYSISGLTGPHAAEMSQITITYYNELKKAQRIYDSNTGGEFNFVYGNDDERIKMTYSVSGSNHYTRYYQPNFDRQENADGTYKEWCYVFAPSGLCAVSYNNNGTQKTLQVTTDHLGSPVMLTDHSIATPTVVEENAFDAWGRRRDPDDWNTLISSTSLLIRGYQQHEMLGEMDLINMNGRIYDPILGRFLAPDDYMQDPDNLQNFNRYSYCFNNPLKYTDPSGYTAHYTGSAINYVTPESYLGNFTLDNNYGVYVDGDKVYGGEGDFWLSNSTGVASIEYFDVWNGNGPGMSGKYVTYGSLLDQQKLITTVSSYVYVSGSDFAKLYPQVSNVATGRSADFATAGGYVLKEQTIFNQAAVDAAQSGWGNEIQGNGVTIEQLLRSAMNMPSGSEITGDDIAKMNPKFSKAGAAIKTITKVNNGVQLKLTWTGRAVVSLSNEYSDIDGSVFNLSNHKSKYGPESVHVQSNTAQYGGKPFNIYINDNQSSLHGDFFSDLFKK